MHSARSKHPLLILLALFLLLFIAGVSLVYFSDSGEEPIVPSKPRASTALAILGDSDSHSFKDTVAYPIGSAERGGKYRAITFNWPDILVRLRNQHLDLGERRIWGPPKPIAKARELAGLPVRRPRKQDYRHNFAINGAGCKDLNQGWRQVDRLLAVMALEPGHWRNGVVVIRIGINSFAQSDALDAFAADPRAPEQQHAMTECIGAIETAVARLRASEPTLRFVLVGIFNNVHWAKRLDRWQSSTQLSNISNALDRFDDALRRMAADDPNIAFFDDRAWFKTHWGDRDANGLPNYRTVELPSGLKVTNTFGDEPSNAVLADGHAGTVWNGLWTKRLVELLNEEFHLQIPPISDDEIAALVTRRDPELE